MVEYNFYKKKKKGYGMGYVSFSEADDTNQGIRIMYRRILTTIYFSTYVNNQGNFIGKLVLCLLENLWTYLSRTQVPCSLNVNKIITWIMYTKLLQIKQTQKTSKSASILIVKTNTFKAKIPCNLNVYRIRPWATC